MRKLTGILARCGVVLGLFVAAGCHSPSQRLPESSVDPLLGPEAPSLPQKGGVVSPSGPEARLTTPLPLTRQTSSTAEMAGGPLKGGREALGIPVTNDNSGRKAWQENDGGKTVLKTPQPIAQGLTPVPIFPNDGTASPGSGATLQELQKELEAKGAVEQKEVPSNGGVHFACLVPNPDGTIRLYEVEAADTAAAIRAVLAKIDQKR